MRRLSDVVSESFIWGVGITHPKPGQERLAALYITATLAGTIAAVIGAFFFLLGRF
jgi:hypothetical protein